MATMVPLRPNIGVPVHSTIPARNAFPTIRTTFCCKPSFTTAPTFYVTSLMRSNLSAVDQSSASAAESGCFKYAVRIYANSARHTASRIARVTNSVRFAAGKTRLRRLKVASSSRIQMAGTNQLSSDNSAGDFLPVLRKIIRRAPRQRLHCQRRVARAAGSHRRRPQNPQIW